MERSAIWKVSPRNESRIVPSWAAARHRRLQRPVGAPQPALDLRASVRMTVLRLMVSLEMAVQRVPGLAEQAGFVFD